MVLDSTPCFKAVGLCLGARMLNPGSVLHVSTEKTGKFQFNAMRALLQFILIVLLAALLAGPTFYTLPESSAAMKKCGQTQIHHFVEHDRDNAHELNRPDTHSPGSGKHELCCHLGDYIGTYRLSQSPHLPEPIINGQTLIILFESRTPSLYYPVEVSPG